MPITFNVYTVVANEPGAKITTLTRTFQIPYRPSANVACDGTVPGGWFSTVNATCYNGLATKITFDFTVLGVLLPNQVIVGVTYNTTTAGYNPIGAVPPGTPSCPAVPPLSLAAPTIC